MRQKISLPTLKSILQNEDIAQLNSGQMVKFFLEEEGTNKFKPDGICQVDPRSGERVIYNSSRARRPHDNRSMETTESVQKKECFICQGKTTNIIDIAPLSEGFTFINKNLYPILFPHKEQVEGHKTLGLDTPDPGPGSTPAYGLHFLQWTSSYHDNDWHNMPQPDREIVMKRLATLEGKLFEEWPDHFVGIIKNDGRLVGGSLAHGHQQIALSNLAPRHFLEDWRFEKEHGESFSSYLQRENHPDLVVCDYGPALLVTPYFMRRPYDMILLMKHDNVGRLHELSEQELAAFAQGWHDAIRAIYTLMPKLGKEIAYNVTVHNGTAKGLYCEFLPYTQETGGYEHLGLSVCHLAPQTAAEMLREVLEE